MKKNNLKNILKSSLFLLSLFLINLNFVFAEDNFAITGAKNIKETVNSFTDNVLTSLTTALMTGAFVIFFYGVVRFIYDRSSGDDARLAKDKEAMLWGLGALFVMVSTWGIIKMFQGFLGIQGDSNIQIKSVQFLSPTVSGGSSDTVDPSAGVTGGKKSFSDPEIDVSVGTSISSETANLIDSNLKKYSCFPLGLNSIGKSYDNSDTFMIKEFQRVNDLDVTGVIDNSTWKTFNGSANKCDYTQTIVKAPIQDPAVSALFYYLKYYNCTNGITGENYGTTYDNTDLEYTKNFQRKNGLKDDGIVGENTWKKLMSGTANKCK